LSITQTSGVVVTRKHILSIGLLIVVVAAAAAWVTCVVCRARKSPEARAIVHGVTARSVMPVDVNEYFETAGTLKARTVSQVASRIMGTVTALKVKQGDLVKAGQVLLEIDDKDLVERYKAAQAASDEAGKALDAAKERTSLATTTYARYKTLVEQNAVAKQQFDEVASQLKVTEADLERATAAAARAASNLEEARVTLGYAKVTAPTDGVVTWRNIEVGSMARPGEPLITVEDNSQFRVDINVDERLAGMVKVGMPVDVYTESINERVKAEVMEVVPSVEPTTRTFLVKLLVPNSPRLVTGLHARVHILTGKRKAMLVPEAAVVRKGQLTGVYVVAADSVVNYRLVRTGKTFGDQVEVLSGLGDGEKVVTGGVDRAVDGGVVESGNN
jgi:RND family efflux transporter MFP subunit